LIGAGAAATRKPVIGWLLSALPSAKRRSVGITWWVALLSGLFGSYSHVALDSMMHADVRPFAPFSSSNGLLGAVPLAALHDVLLFSGVIGMVLYVMVSIVASRSNTRIDHDSPRR